MPDLDAACLDSPSIYFMFDNHTFAKIEFGSRESVLARIRELFAIDGCGSVFVRHEQLKPRGLFDEDPFYLPGRQKADGKWGITEERLSRWADELFAINWHGYDDNIFACGDKDAV